MSGWETVRGKDVRVGDLIAVGGRVVRIDALDTYEHEAFPAARIARYQSPYAPQHVDGITIFDTDRVAVSR